MAPIKRHRVPLAGGSSHWALLAGAAAGISAGAAHSPSRVAGSNVLQVSALLPSLPYCSLGCLEVPCPQSQAVTKGTAAC